MSESAKRSTVYFEADIHNALRVKAAHSHRSVSEIVNEVVRRVLREDQEALAAFDERGKQREISYEALAKAVNALCVCRGVLVVDAVCEKFAHCQFLNMASENIKIPRAMDYLG